MTPPAWRSAQPHKAGGLRGDAVDGDKLLLLADCAQEPQRVRAEADQPQDRECREAECRAAPHPQALSHPLGCEHEKRQHQPRRDLDPDADHQRAGGGAKARARPGGQCQRGGEEKHQQRVVVRATHGQLEQHGIEADECGCPARGVTQPARGAGDHGDGAEAREHGNRLECPQPAGDPERRRRVARKREQRPVRGMLERPSDEWKHRIGRCFRGDMRVGVQAVQRPHAGEVQVAKDILGDQRRAEEQGHVRHHDRNHDCAQRQRGSCQQDRQVARAHDQRQCLKTAARDAHTEAFERPGHPARPATAARRDVLRGPARGAGRQQEDRRYDAEKPQRAKGAQGPRAIAETTAGGERGGRIWSDSDALHWACGEHRLIVASTPPASVWCAR
jgi:hypothetical protein